jgi:phosphoribosyl 1,2-cyclic phosphodiesterase
MEQYNLPMEALDAIFVTHFHNDHIADIGEAMQRSYLLGREKDLVIYGPTGTAAMVEGFNTIYAEDSSYRTEHHTEEFMPSAYHFATASEFSADEDVIEVYPRDGVVVTAFRVAHPPIEPIFGYTIEFAGHKLVELMENTFREMGNERNAIIFYDIREYHADVNDIGRGRTVLRQYPDSRARYRPRHLRGHSLRAGESGRRCRSTRPDVDPDLHADARVYDSTESARRAIARTSGGPRQP